ncbi:uncharacterized protein LOC142575555 isoform X2 [Dermacentor variabilis]|uniref:uncharacterized protein LOC142575555 isoform X2 n=2 Tax=Dermacentor variabilis TaxID=34621 RepID=UPI003F5C97E6
MKHRNHPGARKRKQVKLPEKLIDAANTVLETQNMTHLREAAVVTRNQLWSLHLPIENDELRARAMNIEKDLYGYTLERMNPEERDYVEEDVKEKVFEKLKKRIRLWKPMKYDDFGARSYVVAQLAANYAAVHDVFHEIRHLNPAFAPASMMDFGSGLGSCFWAARSIWPKYFQEYFSIDISNEMHGLARLLATGENANGQGRCCSFFQREFLPATDKIAFDLVVSAFSLMELPNAIQRLETVASLWGKTNALLVALHGVAWNEPSRQAPIASTNHSSVRGSSSWTSCSSLSARRYLEERTHCRTEPFLCWALKLVDVFFCAAHWTLLREESRCTLKRPAGTDGRTSVEHQLVGRLISETTNVLARRHLFASRNQLPARGCLWAMNITLQEEIRPDDEHINQINDKEASQGMAIGITFPVTENRVLGVTQKKVDDINHDLTGKSGAMAIGNTFQAGASGHLAFTEAKLTDAKGRFKNKGMTLGIEFQLTVNRDLDVTQAKVQDLNNDLQGKSSTTQAQAIVVLTIR